MSHSQIREMLALSNEQNVEDIGAKHLNLLRKNRFDADAYSYLVSRLKHIITQDKEIIGQQDRHLGVMALILQEDHELQSDSEGSQGHLKEMIVLDNQHPSFLLLVRYVVKDERLQLSCYSRHPSVSNLKSWAAPERKLLNHVVNVLNLSLWRQLHQPISQANKRNAIKFIYSSDFSETMMLPMGSAGTYTTDLINS